MDRDFRHWRDEFSTPLTDARHLLHDLLFQIPGQNQQIIRLRFKDPFGSVDRNAAAWQKPILLMRIAINHIGDIIRPRAAEIEQGIALRGSAIANDRLTLFLGLLHESMK